MTVTDEVFAMAARVLDVKPGKKVMEHVVARVKAGKCLHCDKPASRRGLCGTHYFAYRRAKAGKTRAEAIELDTKAIQAGKILPDGMTRQIRSPNPFLT